MIREFMFMLGTYPSTGRGSPRSVECVYVAMLIVVLQSEFVFAKRMRIQLLHRIMSSSWDPARESLGEDAMLLARAVPHPVLPHPVLHPLRSTKPDSEFCWDLCGSGESHRIQIRIC